MTNHRNKRLKPSYGLSKKKITHYQFSAFVFSLFTDIHLIFVTLLCHTKLQIKFKFGFDPLNLHGLSKILRIVRF
jgi:hypothetical protein